MENQPTQQEPINITIKKAKSKRASKPKKQVVAEVIEKEKTTQEQPVISAPVPVVSAPVPIEFASVPEQKPKQKREPKAKTQKKDTVTPQSVETAPAIDNSFELERQKYREHMEIANNLTKQLEDLELRVQGRKTARQNVELMEKIEMLQEQLKELGDYVEFKPKQKSAIAIPKSSFQGQEEIPKRLPASQIVKSFGF